jgi:formate dehydrogenase subunit beta
MNRTASLSGERKTLFREILRGLLQEGRISAVFSLRRFKNGVIDYGLITRIEDINMIEPFYPLMPANAGQLLSRFTSMEKPVAAIVKPCEFRAFVEMVKREQGSIANFIFFTYSCGGVFPLKDSINDDINDKLAAYNAAWENLLIPEEIRETCTCCEHLHPEEADVYISVAGANEMQLCMQTEKAELLLADLRQDFTEGLFDDALLSELLEKRKANKEKVFAAVDTSESGLDGLIDIFGRCIGCHGCNRVCPICYCTLCDFDSSNYDYNRPLLEKELAQKGAIRLPPDTLFFHLGRMSHMSFSCVGCGMCSDVCPADIPVASVFKRTGEKTAAMFDFIAGRSVQEKIPVMIYKEEEFPEMGE